MQQPEPLVTAASQSLLPSEPASAEAADKLRAAGILSLQQQDYKKAEENLEHALAMYEIVYQGKPHESIGLTLLALKSCYQFYEDYEEAEKYSARAQENAKALAKTSSLQLAEVISKIPETEKAYQQGTARWQEAAAVLQQAILFYTVDSVIVYKQCEVALLNDEALQQLLEQQPETKIASDMLAYYILVTGYFKAGQQQLMQQWLVQFSEDVKLRPTLLNRRLLALVCDRVKLDAKEKENYLYRTRKAREQDELLLKAAQKGNVVEIQNCLDNGADIEIHRSFKIRFTPLMFAVREQHVKAVELLLVNKADIHEKESRVDGSFAAFHFAIYKANATIVELLLRHGASFDTPWHEAAYRGDIAQLDILLNNLTDKSLLPIVDKTGTPFTFYAVANDKLDVLQWCRRNDVPLNDNDLIQKQALQNNRESNQKLNTQNQFGSTLFLFSVASGKGRIVKWLIEEGISSVKESGRYRADFAMLIAIKNGDLLLAQWLHSKGVPLREQGDDGEISLSLWYAIKRGHIECVKWLVANGINIKEDQHADTHVLLCVLHEAACNGQLMIVNWLVEQGVSLREKYDGNTALHTAAKSGHLVVIQWMVAQGMSIHDANKDGETALLIAIAKGYLAIVKLLLQHGAVLENGEKLNNAFTQALKCGNKELFDYLVEQGFDIHNYLDAKNQQLTLLYSAIDTYGSNETMSWFLTKKPSLLESVDSEGNTVVLYALKCQSINTRLIKCLIRLGARLDVKDKDENTALMYAFRDEHSCSWYNLENLLMWLLAQKAISIHSKNKDGETALHYAIRCGFMKFAKQLVEQGAPLEEANPEYRDTPLFQAIREGKSGFAFWLLENYNPCVEEKAQEGKICNSALHMAVCYGADLPFFEKLVKMISSLELKDSSGKTPLLCAIRHGNLTAAKYLVEQGASLQAKDNGGNTALLLAACSGNTELIAWILESGASLEEKNNDNDTALFNAINWSKDAAAKWLVEHGANLSARDSYNRTPLLAVVYNEKMDDTVAKCLIEHGAKVDEIDGSGTTSLLAAISIRKVALAQWLVEHGAQVNKVANTSFGPYPGMWGALTPLECAIDKREFDFAKWLIEEKKAAVANSEIVRALIMASKNEDSKAFAYWLIEQKGVPLNQALCVAAKENDLHAASLLLKRGALLEKDIYNNSSIVPTAMDYAISNDKADMTSLLLQYGLGIGLVLCAYDMSYARDRLPEGVMNNQLVIGMRLGEDDDKRRITRKTPGFEKAITTFNEFVACQHLLSRANYPAYIRVCTHYLTTHPKGNEIGKEIKALRTYLILKQESSLTQSCISFISKTPALRAKALSSYLPVELKAQIEHAPEIKIDEIRSAKNKS